MKPTCTITQSEVRSYRKVDYPEASKYDWECALIVTDENPDKTIGQYCGSRGGCGNDVKYSQTMVNREHRVCRSLSITEFYGNSVVD